MGGERGHSEDHYKESLARSLRTSFKLLRPDRWLSIVFQHWDLSYFSTILETATSCGAELRTAITQTGDVIWSMHKKKNSASVIAGEMILTFYKSKRPAKSHDSPAVADQRDPGLILGDVFDACLSNGGQTFTNEALFNRLVVELWHRRSLRCLSLDRRTFAQELERRGWTYSPRTHLWTRNDATFGGRGRQSLFEE